MTSMRKAPRLRRLATLALPLLVAGGLGCCGGGTTTDTVPDMPDDQAHRGDGYGSTGSSVFAGSSGAEQVSTERQPEDGPYVREVWIAPDPPLASQPLVATAKVENPAGGSVMVSYRWWVAGDEMVGVRGDTLPMGRFKRDDAIEIEVTAKDINGRSDSHKFSNIVVANSTPQVVSNLPAATSFDGMTMQAVDPDGDPVEWRIEGAPPGVTIERNTGRIDADMSKVFESGTYTMRIVARDPAGAEGSLTLEAQLGGSVQAKEEYVEDTQRAVVDGEDLTEEEYIERTEEFLDRMKEMTDEELEAYLDSAEQASDDLEAAAATELPSGTRQGPYTGD